MARSALLAALALALVASTLASEFTSPNVVHLTAANFEEKVGGAKGRRRAGNVLMVGRCLQCVG